MANHDPIEEIRERWHVPPEIAERHAWLKGILEQAVPFPVYDAIPQYLVDIHALLAEVDRLQQLAAQAREEAYYDVMEFVVLDALDTSVGRRVHDYIERRLAELKAGGAA